jgi:hypothetical protein
MVTVRSDRFSLIRIARILEWYLARPSRAAFLCRMLIGTLRRVPKALPQTFSYLAYFIHLREYAERVVAKAWQFNYCFENVDLSRNRFGEHARAPTSDPTLP